VQVVLEYLERKAVENPHDMKLVGAGVSGGAEHCPVGAGPTLVSEHREDHRVLNGEHF